MGAIYARADRVLVCMGDAVTAGADARVAELVELSAPLVGESGPGRGHDGADETSVADDHELAVMLEAMHDSWSKEEARCLLLEKREASWASVRELLNRSWFRRVWVVQEVGLARNPVVLFGNESFGYRRLIKMVDWAASQWELAGFEVSLLLIHYEWADWACAAKTLEKTFYDLIDHASLLSCKDPRDRIYAFLGHPLARVQGGDGDTDMPIIIPDYAKELNELYLDVQKLFLDMVGVRALVAVEHDEESLTDGYPSWVTRWHISNKPNNISRLPAKTFSAGGPVDETYQPDILGSVLKLKGAAVDTLWKVFQIDIADADFLVCFSDGESPSKQLTLRKMLDFLTSEDTPCIYHDERGYATSERALNGFGTTLCGGQPWHSGYRRYRDGLMWLLSANGTGSSRLTEPLSPRHEADMRLYFVYLEAKCRGRAFAVTAGGRYCLTPRRARPGDQVCIIRGLDVPFVMRVDGRRRVLLEEAYVHGIMEGEAMEMISRRELMEATFVIQ
ncbi:hypothetical protein QBC34DRAFT_419311 [Podospora aff. communis PSN243]|uniref:Heterokaryon incompatibility domain-containing protein n=1 Tax=Podospora aff. communis PSN243 TaxID=3040156 RepID=A0AAV9FZG6_9PEZI|nr:hypothetical protein QBC34DRAFT_419311 [Podospora aff. communis PSN243]